MPTPVPAATNSTHARVDSTLDTCDDTRSTTSPTSTRTCSADAVVRGSVRARRLEEEWSPSEDADGMWLLVQARIKKCYRLGVSVTLSTLVSARKSHRAARARGAATVIVTKHATHLVHAQ